MLHFIAWSLVVASFLFIGLLGYLIGRPRASSTLNCASPAAVIIVSMMTPFILNGIAAQVFTAIELDTISTSGAIREDQIQPDMPNLLAGMIFYGWAFFLAGLLGGRARWLFPGFFRPTSTN